MQQLAVKATVTHRMVLFGQHTDALTGEEWELYQCGECEELWKVRFDPWKRVKIRQGSQALTEQDAIEILALCKQGPVGQAKAMEIMAREPGHVLLKVPTEDEVRELAIQQGTLEQFEEAVDQAIIKGKPLIYFSMGGATAETRPKGSAQWADYGL